MRVMSPLVIPLKNLAIWRFVSHKSVEINVGVSAFCRKQGVFQRNPLVTDCDLAMSECPAGPLASNTHRHIPCYSCSQTARAVECALRDGSLSLPQRLREDVGRGWLRVSVCEAVCELLPSYRLALDNGRKPLRGY